MQETITYTRQRALALWVIWFALFAAVLVYQFALGGGIPSGSNAPSDGMSPILVLAGGQLVVASMIRWILMPRADNAEKVLVWMILGLSLSEAVELYGIFLISNDQPSTKLTLWVLSILSVLQFIPVYALPKSRGSETRSG